MAVINRIAEYFDEMKTWRRHLHAHPELGFDCFETAAFVVEKLKEFGVDEIHEGIAETGLVALIRGTGTASPDAVIGLRADMDALPMQEMRDPEYKSTIPGKMHACGHDGHTTMLLGAAKYLAQTRNFSGTVALIFQPAEESGGGGEVMCQEGIMDRFAIQQVYGIHNMPNFPFGEFSTRVGPILAAADDFEIHITGAGGHGAMPDQAVDPVMIAVQIAQALQTIVTRNVDPIETSVLSITQIQTGSTHNVIPGEAFMQGTVRTMKKEVQSLIAQRMENIVTQVAQAMGGAARLVYNAGYPATVNHARETAFTVDVARGIVGPERVVPDVAPTMGAEDFSYMLEQRPGSYIYLGTGEGASLHHPEYDFNDEVSPIGASFFVKLVETAQPT